MLLPVRLLSLGRPLIYDEFINPIEWVSYEHKKIGKYNPLTGLLWLYYRLLLAWASLTLTDTESHADLSAGMMKVRRDKFLTLPVGTDEANFTTEGLMQAENDVFTVLYYGNMLPLHGLEYVLEAAVAMNHEPVKFVLVGGNAKVAHDVAFAVGNGANIDYKAWVDYDQLPKLMNEADLCLAGPFGDTFQAQYVITGKAYQYLAMGRPTVVGQNKESDVFTDRKNALIVRQGNAEALVGAIRWAMDHKAELRMIGKQGQELYHQELSVKRITERLEPVLRTLVRD
jgi:glycosyltransferase involved in cell wall biosynthesis